jgi:hypothetical protein
VGSQAPTRRRDIDLEVPGEATRAAEAYTVAAWAHGDQAVAVARQDTCEGVVDGDLDVIVC